jgi:15-cis-phytoene desaturase
MGEEVVVLGAGVAGLTAAHELSERGFRVEVYERRDVVGGKARSFILPDGRPAEHGFRFFPGFYKHLRHTMERIPYRGQPHGVLDNLMVTRDVQVLQQSKPPIDLPTRLWRLDTRFLAGVRLGARHKFTATFGLPRHDAGLLIDRLRTLLRACPERRFAEYETQDWLDFADAVKDDQYRKIVCALTRSLVAARADQLSARTGGYILLQLQLAVLRPRAHLPSVLNGPTSTVWLEPWREYLRSRGVEFHLEHTVREFHCAGGRIEEVIVEDKDGNRRAVRERWYVAALPFEIMRDLVTPEMIEADPSLAGLKQLQDRWMNGVMFYLRRDETMVYGHTIYIDSPWALTSISQRQFWARPELGRVNGQKVAGVLSVDISDWDSPGIVHGKAARSCTKQEIVNEVLTQIRQHLATTKTPYALDDANIAGWFVDDDILPPNLDGAAVNLEPLLVNTTGSWAHRPEAATGIENLFLASDYVRTYTDLATMEGANEAARRAVNGILERSPSASAQPWCKTWPLHDPGGLFTIQRRIDRKRLRREDPLAFEAAAELIEELTFGLPDQDVQPAGRLGRLRRGGGRGG